MDKVNVKYMKKSIRNINNEGILKYIIRIYIYNFFSYFKLCVVYNVSYFIGILVFSPFFYFPESKDFAYDQIINLNSQTWLKVQTMLRFDVILHSARKF